MPLTRIAVVGSGFSGTILSCHLLRRGSSLDICLIDQSEIFGPGIAYGTKDESHILNVPAVDMGAFPDEPDHFFRWLSPRRPNTAPTDFVERSWYGLYLSELLIEARQTKKPGNALRYFKEVATGAVPLDNGSVDLQLASGRTLNCDYVVLALGNLPPGSRHPFTALGDSERYIRHFWKSPVWNALDPKASLLIVGTGLSMVDAVLSCGKKGHQGRIHAVSRRGLLPRVHARSPALNLELPQPPYTVRQLLHWIRSQSRSASSNGWISVMNVLRPQVNELWQHLSLEERQRFLRHASSYWDVHRHRMPPTSAETLETLRSEQKLEVFAGKVLEVEEKAQGLRVLLKKRRGGTVRLDVDYVLDCSGTGRSIRKLPSTLIQSLLNQGLIQSDPLEIGVAADEAGRCHTSSRATGPIFAIGSLLKGIVWETSAVRELRIQCQTTAEALLKAVKVSRIDADVTARTMTPRVWPDQRTSLNSSSPSL